MISVSASQVKDYDACARLWFYKNILKSYPPKTVPQRKGTAIHGTLEAYLKIGEVDEKHVEDAKEFGLTKDDLQAFVGAIKPLVGEPGKGLIEHFDQIDTYEGGPLWKLVVDHAHEIEVPGFGVVPQISDLKSLSDFRYCKTPEQLKTDVQMVSYGKWVLIKLIEQSIPMPQLVSLRHVYVRTRGKTISTVRDVLVTPEEIEAQWQKILGTVREMVALAESGKTDAQDVPPNTASCNNYGGCFFRAKCFGDTYDSANPVVGLFTKEKKDMSTNGTATTPPPHLRLLDRLKGVAAPAATSTASPAVAAVAPAAATATCGSIWKVAPHIICTLVPHTGDHESVAQPDGGVISWNDKTSSIGSSKDWKPLIAAVAPAVDVTTVAQVTPPDAPPRTSTPEQVAAAQAPAKGRRKKLEIQTPVAATTVAPAAATTTAAPAATTVTPITVAPAVCALEDLYVDCFPVKGGAQAILADELIMAASDAAAKAGNVPDWRMIEYVSKGVLATAFRSLLGVVPKSLVVSSSIPGADVLLEVLTPHARRVVRALRG